MAWIRTAAAAPVSYLEERLGFADSSVTLEESLALLAFRRSAGAGVPLAPARGNLPPRRS